MSVSKYNSQKRNIFKVLTSSFKNSSYNGQLNQLSKNDKIRVLITRPNHRLGNQLLLTPLIQEIKQHFPNSSIDLVLNGTLSSVLFSNYKYVDTVFNLPKKPFKHLSDYLKQSARLLFNRYDIAIAGCEASNSSKIYVKLSRARFKIYDSGTQSLDKPKYIAKYPVYNFKTFLNPNQDLSRYEYSKLALNLSTEEIEHGQHILKRLFDNDKKTICIFTFATGAKCHSKEWWSECYHLLKSEFKDYNILEMLPIENVSQIDFKSTHFYSKDLREIAAVIENSAVFIGADSGMMHLSAATNTTTLGLFNVTKPEVYGPYGGNNQAIDTNTTSIEELIKIVSAALIPTSHPNPDDLTTS